MHTIRAQLFTIQARTQIISTLYHNIYVVTISNIVIPSSSSNDISIIVSLSRCSQQIREISTVHIETGFVVSADQCTSNVYQNVMSQVHASDLT